MGKIFYVVTVLLHPAAKLLRNWDKNETGWDDIIADMLDGIAYILDGKVDTGIAAIEAAVQKLKNSIGAS